MGRSVTITLACIVTAVTATYAADLPPPAVGIVTAKAEQITQTDSFPGRVVAINRVNLVARVTALLESQEFVEGSEVAQGQQLFQLEKPPFEADVEQRAGAVAQIQATVANDQLRYNRAATLLNTPAGQRSTLDDARAQLDADQGQLLQNQALLRAARINLGYTDITAPIDGKIGRTLITPGNVVSPGSGTLATIVSQDPMYIDFPISRAESVKLRDRYATHGGLEAVKLKIRLPNGNLYAQTGKLVFVDNNVNQLTDTILFRGKIANPTRKGLAPGSPGSRELVDGQFVDVLVEGVAPVVGVGVPQAAVLADQQGSYVFVVGDDDIARRTPVQLGQSTATTAIVTSGLRVGQRVVLDGLQRVKDNAKVAPAPAALPATSEPGNAPQD